MFESDRKNARKGMHIIIVGCGKVGASLTERLYSEGHDITVVDKRPERIQNLIDMYDIMGIVGNGASYQIQVEAGIDKADLMIAVTDSDELNLLCCTIAKKVGDCASIARVRTPDYSDDVAYLKEKLGLAMIINPELEAANEIVRVLNLPAALGVNSFTNGKAEMVRFKIPENNRLCGLSLAELGKSRTAEILICAIERMGQVYIPDGNFVLQAGDVVSFISTVKEARGFFERISIQAKPIRTTMIIGGGKAAYYLAKQLLKMGIAVKIIEQRKERCEELSELLPDAIIINGDGTDADLLKEEEIGYVDSLVALTGIDEENILLTLHAQEVSHAKVVTKIKRNTFHNIINKLDLGSVIYPKYITAEAIIAYVRARNASRDSNNIETLYHLFDSRVEAIEFRIDRASHLSDTKLKDLKLKDNVLIACINRKGRIIIPGGMDSIQMGDSVIVVTKHTGFQNLEDILK